MLGFFVSKIQDSLTVTRLVNHLDSTIILGISMRFKSNATGQAVINALGHTSSNHSTLKLNFIPVIKPDIIDAITNEPNNELTIFSFPFIMSRSCIVVLFG